MFDLHYLDEGKGLPFVFLHGLGGESSQAQSLLAGMEGIRLLCLDNRGHGKSPLGPNAKPSFERYAEDVMSLLDHLGIEEALVGGISMGSGIALRAALHQPDRVKGLVLVRPAWLDEPQPACLEVLAELADYVDQPNGDAAFQQTDSFRSFHAQSPEAAASVLGQFHRQQGQHTARIFRSMIGDTPFFELEDLADLDMPSLVLACEDDPLHPFAFGQTIADHLPASTLVQVASRYLDNTRYEEDVRNAVRDFLPPFLV